MTHAVTTVAAPTSGGTPVAQAISVACGGKTPKAVWIRVTRATSAGTAVAGAMLSSGVSDGTNVRCAAGMAETAQLSAASDTGHQGSASVIVRVLDTADQTVVAEAAFSSFAADTVNLSWTTLPTTALLLVVEAFYGDDLSAAVGQFTCSATLNGTVTVSGLAFRPRGVVFVSRQNDFALGGAGGVKNHHGFVALNEDGTVQGQRGMNYASTDRPAGTTALSLVANSNEIGGRLGISAAGVTQASLNRVTSGTSDGFVVTTVGPPLPASPNAFVVGYLALRYGLRRFWVGEGTGFDATSTGVQTFNDPAFPPSSVFCLGAGTGTADSWVLRSAALSVGSANATGAACAGLQDETGAATSDTRSMADTLLAHVLDDAGATDWAATLDSLSQTGFSINVTDAAAGARLAYWMAIERPLFEPGWLPAIRRWRRQIGRM